VLGAKLENGKKERRKEKKVGKKGGEPNLEKSLACGDE
jgi:hypothetical protein